MILIDTSDPQSMRLRTVLRDLGYETEYPRVNVSGSYPSTGVEAVFGKIDFTYQAFDALGIPRPAPMPIPLFKSWKMLKRDVDEMTVARVRWMLGTTDVYELFVKPSRELKKFTGRVFREGDYDLSRYDSDLPVYVSSVVHFRHEWRVLVCRGKRLVVPCYSELCREISPSELDEVDGWIESMENPPAGYSMDVGYAEGKGLCLIELNDGWSLGGYGEDEALLEVVFARFEELLATSTHLSRPLAVVSG